MVKGEMGGSRGRGRRGGKREVRGIDEERGSVFKHTAFSTVVKVWGY